MFNIIERYMNKLTIDDVNRFALSKGCNLSDSELDFTYLFIKKNWKILLKNPNSFDIERYKDKYSEENYVKIKKVYQEYFQKFSSFL